MQKTIVTCGKCSQPSITYNPFMTLSVSVENNLEKCIANFLKDYTLESTDKYKCEMCK